MSKVFPSNGCNLHGAVQNKKAVFACREQRVSLFVLGSSWQQKKPTVEGEMRRWRLQSERADG